MNEENPTDIDSLKALWSQTVEIFFHQILYCRRLYPKESFSQSRFLGVHCKVNRNQEVVAYISEAVNVVVAALFDCVSNEVSIELLQGQGEKCEKYYLELNLEPYKAESLADVERDMKNLILGVYSLEKDSTGGGGGDWDSSATFKISLFLLDDYKNSGKLSQAFSKNEWFCPYTESEASRAEIRRSVVVEMKSSSAVFSCCI